MSEATKQFFYDKLDAYLAKNALKQTKQRNHILKYLLEAKEHITPEDVRDLAKKDGHNIGLSTIYRTMNLFLLAGLVTQASFAGDRSFYELMDPDSHHDHLICLACGKIVEFVSSEIERLQDLVAHENGFRIESHKLEIFGHCEGCQKKEIH